MMGAGRLWRASLIRFAYGELDELVTVLGSNLRSMVTHNLVLQLYALKEHVGIKFFAVYR